MMKVHFILSFLISLLMATSVNASTSQFTIKSYVQGLPLHGEFTENSGYSLVKPLPAAAGTKDGVLYIEFISPVGQLSITISGPEGNTYSSSVNVNTNSMILTIPVADYTAGSYLLEMKTLVGGYVFGNFIVE